MDNHFKKLNSLFIIDNKNFIKKDVIEISKIRTFIKNNEEEEIIDENMSIQ